MARTKVDRRLADRRRNSRGGRRAGDGAVTGASLKPECPACGSSSTVEAGSSDGGWWFVCSLCDHLWDERLRRAGRD